MVRRQKCPSEHELMEEKRLEHISDMMQKSPMMLMGQRPRQVSISAQYVEGKSSYLVTPRTDVTSPPNSAQTHVTDLDVCSVDEYHFDDHTQILVLHHPDSKAWDFLCNLWTRFNLPNSKAMNFHVMKLIFRTSDVQWNKDYSAKNAQPLDYSLFPSRTTR